MVPRPCAELQVEVKGGSTVVIVVSHIKHRAAGRDSALWTVQLTFRHCSEKVQEVHVRCMCIVRRGKDATNKWPRACEGCGEGAGLVLQTPRDQRQ